MAAADRPRRRARCLPAGKPTDLQPDSCPDLCTTRGGTGRDTADAPSWLPTPRPWPVQSPFPTSRPGCLPNWPPRRHGRETLIVLRSSRAMLPTPTSRPQLLPNWPSRRLGQLRHGLVVSGWRPAGPARAAFRVRSARPVRSYRSRAAGPRGPSAGRSRRTLHARGSAGESLYVSGRSCGHDIDSTPDH